MSQAWEKSSEFKYASLPEHQTPMMIKEAYQGIPLLNYQMPKTKQKPKTPRILKELRGKQKINIKVNPLDLHRSLNTNLKARRAESEVFQALRANSFQFRFTWPEKLSFKIDRKRKKTSSEIWLYNQYSKKCSRILWAGMMKTMLKNQIEWKY